MACPSVGGALMFSSYEIKSANPWFCTEGWVKLKLCPAGFGAQAQVGVLCSFTMGWVGVGGDGGGGGCQSSHGGHPLCFSSFKKNVFLYKSMRLKSGVLHNKKLLAKCFERGGGVPL